MTNNPTTDLMLDSSDKKTNPIVGIIMGSDSDLPTMREAAVICEEFSVPYDIRIVSAHRTPVDMAEYGTTARVAWRLTAHIRGIKIIIAGAGGAAHLPGMIASYSPLPVIGVPIQSKVLNGIDSLFSIVQMPPGIPVATMSIGAGLFAIQILSLSDCVLSEKLIQYRSKMADDSRQKNNNLTQ